MTAKPFLSGLVDTAESPLKIKPRVMSLDMWDSLATTKPHLDWDMEARRSLKKEIAGSTNCACVHCPHLEVRSDLVPHNLNRRFTARCGITACLIETAVVWIANTVDSEFLITYPQPSSPERIGAAIRDHFGVSDWVMMRHLDPVFHIRTPHGYGTNSITLKQIDDMRSERGAADNTRRQMNVGPGLTFHVVQDEHAELVRSIKQRLADKALDVELRAELDELEEMEALQIDASQPQNVPLFA